MDVWKEAITVDGTRKVHPAGFASVDTKVRSATKAAWAEILLFVHPSSGKHKRINKPSPSRSGAYRESGCVKDKPPS
jgi:hypothetical protein